MKYNPHVFKAYDIRGVFPTQIDEQFAFHLGLAFGSLVKSHGEDKVCVGRDGRLSGPSLLSALSSGLVQAGLEVINLGLCTTPMLYFGAHTLSQSGIQITGSHNPKDYNGFKMVANGRALYGKDIQNLQETMQLSRMAELASDSAPTGHGFEHQVKILPSYRQRILSDIHLSRPMKIVVDSGNGVAGASAPGIFRALGAQVIELFSEVDGHFPNHHPDPSKPENLKDLIAAIELHDAELGFAFDGDGDRLGVVTRQGHNIYPDRQMQLFAQDVLERVPAAMPPGSQPTRAEAKSMIRRLIPPASMMTPANMNRGTASRLKESAPLKSRWITMTSGKSPCRAMAATEAAPIAMAMGVSIRKSRNNTGSRISAVTVFPLYVPDQEKKTVAGQQQSADRDDGKDQPFGQGQGRGDLQADKIAEDGPMVDHYQKKTKGDQMDEDGIHPAQVRSHSGGEQVDPRMGLAPVGGRGPEKGQPDQDVPGQFLRPEQGVVQQVAAEDLGRDDNGHGDPQGGEQVLNPPVELGIDSGKDLHAAGSYLTAASIFTSMALTLGSW